MKKISRLNFEKEYSMLDSKIVRAIRHIESYGFNKVIAVWIGEF